jgi:hypothetical protein
MEDKSLATATGTAALLLCCAIFGAQERHMPFFWLWKTSGKHVGGETAASASSEMIFTSKGNYSVT